MAKSSKAGKGRPGKGGKAARGSERRERLERLERERRAAERRRMLLFAGVVGVLVLAIVAAVGVTLFREQQHQQTVAARDLASFGVPEAAAGCEPVQERPASGGADHVNPPQQVHYETAPPAYGPHRPTWAPFERKFYTTEDRPEVELLVHNLEHGYNILWYDQTVANNQQELSQLEDLAGKFEGSGRDPKNAFIAAPWTPKDGPAFPDGKHVALTHWYADPNGGGHEKGVLRYCEKVSGEVVGQFMRTWTQSEAREPGPGFL